MVGTIQDADANPATTGDQRATENDYDDEGRLIRAVSPEGTIHYQYDPVTGHHARTYTGLADADCDSVAGDGDGKAVTDTRYAYDSLGRLISVTVVERNDAPITPETTEYHYDLLGNLRQERLPNGVVSDYIYDQLSRLELLRQFTDGVGSLYENIYESDVDTLLAEYDYDLAANGRRAGVTERTLVDSVLEETRVDWLYDNLGRLTREVYDSSDDSLDFAADYVFDLVGNRLEKKTDRQPTVQQMADYRADAADGVADVALFDVDEQISSTCDANDRLLIESKDVGGTENDTTTLHEYGPNADPANGDGGDHTQQTRKTVWQGTDTDPATGTKLSETTHAYDLQGRMSRTLVDEDGDGEDDAKYDYAYDVNGIRVSQTRTEDTDDDGLFDDETPIETRYLYDHQNPTGYAQILEEKDAADTVTKTYTLGSDVLGQWDSTNGQLYLLRDGHGSTRGLVDATGQPLSGQVFAYDAFGNRLDDATALTNLLYSGEQTDRTGLQYLRARYYDPATGRFNRLDPFAGDLYDPLSLHKYLYCHANPVMGIDPTGEMLLSAAFGSTISSVLRQLHSTYAIGTKAYIAKTLLSTAISGYVQLRASQLLLPSASELHNLGNDVRGILPDVVSQKIFKAADSVYDVYWDITYSNARRVALVYLLAPLHPVYRMMYTGYVVVGALNHAETMVLTVNRVIYEVGEICNTLGYFVDVELNWGGKGGITALVEKIANPFSLWDPSHYVRQARQAVAGLKNGNPTQTRAAVLEFLRSIREDLGDLVVIRRKF